MATNNDNIGDDNNNGNNRNQITELLITVFESIYIHIKSERESLVCVVIIYERNRRDSYVDRQDDFSLSSHAENGSGFRTALN